MWEGILVRFQLGGSRPTGGEERKNSFDDVLASGFEKMFYNTASIIQEIV